MSPAVFLFSARLPREARNGGAAAAAGAAEASGAAEQRRARWFGGNKESDEASSRERFNRLVLPHLDAAYNLARWLSGHDDRAADIAQEAMLRAFRYRHGLRGEDARAWLLAIVRNTFFSALDERRRHEALHDEYAEEAHGEWTESAGALYQQMRSPEEAFAVKSRARSVNQALESLPVVYRETIVLRDIQDMAYREIALVLGVPAGTVMSRLARGRKMLAKLLQADGDAR